MRSPFIVVSFNKASVKHHQIFTKDSLLQHTEIFELESRDGTLFYVDPFSGPWELMERHWENIWMKQTLMNKHLILEIELFLHILFHYLRYQHWPYWGFELFIQLVKLHWILVFRFYWQLPNLGLYLKFAFKFGYSAFALYKFSAILQGFPFFFLLLEFTQLNYSK